MIIDFLFALLGLIVLIGIAFAFSDNRAHINWRQVGMGISLQIIFALFIILVPWGSIAFDYLAKFFVKIISFTYNGADFVFGFLAWTEKVAQVTPHQGGFIFVFQVLPTLIFFSSLMSVLYHLGIMQRIVQGMAWVMAKTLKISGAESISVAANVFIGQTEAPLVVRPYVDTMTKSELLTLMIGGMATIAGGVLAAYVGLLGGSDPVMQVFYAKHLLGASIMAAPATIVIAKILRPELEHSSTMGNIDLKIETKNSNVIEAAASGASDGMSLALNVAAMLLAFIALIAMLNWLIGLLLTDIFGITIGGQRIHRLFEPGQGRKYAFAKSDHYFHLCPVRVCKFFIDRYPDRRNRGHCPQSSLRDCPEWFASYIGWIIGNIHDSNYCWFFNVAITLRSINEEFFHSFIRYYCRYYPSFFAGIGNNIVFCRCGTGYTRFRFSGYQYRRRIARIYQYE